MVFHGLVPHMPTSIKLKGLGWMTVQNHLHYRDMVLIFNCKKRPSTKVPVIKTLPKITSAPLQNTPTSRPKHSAVREGPGAKTVLCSRSKIFELFKQVHLSNQCAPGFQESCSQGSICLTLSIFHFYILIYSFLYFL